MSTAVLNSDGSIDFYQFGPDGTIGLTHTDPSMVKTLESMLAGWVKSNAQSNSTLTPNMVIVANLAVQDGLITSSQLETWASVNNVKAGGIFVGTPSQTTPTTSQSFATAINDPKLTTDSGVPTAKQAEAIFEAAKPPAQPAHVYVDNAHTEAVQRAYIAYYGRPADTGGLDYWAEQLVKQNGSLEGIINSFGNSAEANSLYGMGTATERITKVYDQLFDRSPDASGLKYWVGEIEAGRVSTASAALQILWGASGEDKARIDNKLLVAKAFTTAIDTQSEIALYAGDTAAANARNYLELVTADGARANKMAGISNTVTIKIDGDFHGDLQLIGIPSAEITEAWA